MLMSKMFDKGKWSAVYEYFERIASEKSKCACKICDKTVKAEFGNTSNSKRHLEHHHHQEFIKLKENMEKAKHTKKLCYDEEPNQPTSSKQPKLDTVFSDIKIWEKTSRRKIEADKALATMVCQDLQPISIVEDRGFKKFINLIQPSYKIPTRRELRWNLIPELYEASQIKIKSKLQTCSSLGITVDHWTSFANEAYMAVTGHFLTEQFEQNNYCFNVQHMPQSHTGVNVASELTEILDFWLPSSKRQIPIFVVCDNASNMQAALHIMTDLPDKNFMGLPCFAHTLQLVLDSALKKFSGFTHIVAKAKKIVNYFHHSAKATFKLREMQKTLNVTEHKLINQCPTRWNSTFYMMSRLYEQKDPITAVLATCDKDKTSNLAAHEWKTVADYVTELKPFEEITRMMSAASYLTVSMVIPMLNVLNKKMCNAELDTFAKEVISNIERRWPDYQTNDLLSIASCLDPRFKQYSFSTGDIRKEAFGKVVNKMVALCDCDEKIKKKSPSCSQKQSQSGESTSSTAAEENSEGSTTSTSTPSDTRYTVWSTFKAMVHESQQHEATEPTKDKLSLRTRMEYELEMFSQEPLLDPQLCPFDWWCRNRIKFPILAKLAQMYLCIPATSVASERMFSKAGAVISKRRNSLKPDHAEQLICLSHNLQ